MRLTRAVTDALTDRTDPAAVLALAYAKTIDQAMYLPPTLAAALETLRRAAAAADVENDDAKASRALELVTKTLTAGTALDRFGPKLLSALDVLLVTPKALAGLGVPPAEPPASEPAAEPAAGVTKLDELRDRHGTRARRAAG